MKKEESKAHMRALQASLGINPAQAAKEKEVKIPPLASEESVAALIDDYTYVMGFLARQIDEMRG